MAMKRGLGLNKTAAQREAEELDGLNAETRRRGNTPQRLRRKMEATIEGKARKRRGRERPASSGWKR